MKFRYYKIGRYTITKKLSSGTYGEILLAKDTKLGRPVVIKKLILKRFLKKEETETIRRRFIREAKLAGKLIHPNIVTIYDVGKINDGFFITMEFVEGQKMGKIIHANSPLPLSLIIKIMLQIATALDFAHGRQIFHKDLTPSSIILNTSDHVKIMDFGLALYTSSEHVTRAGKTVGTPSYMAPEHILGRPLDARADIFSVGVILYQLITGTRPFTGKSVSSIFHKILHTEPEGMKQKQAHIPEQVTRIIARAMKKNPDERYQNAAEMIRDLEAAKDIIALMEEHTGVADLEKPLSHPLPKKEVIRITKNGPKKRERQADFIKAVPAEKKKATADAPFKKQGRLLSNDTMASDMGQLKQKELKEKAGLPEAALLPARGKRKKSYRSEFLLLSGFLLVSALFIITVFYLFWGDAAFLVKFLRSHSQDDVTLDTSSGSADSGLNRPDEGQRNTATTVSVLMVNSDPAQADIYINGQLRGTTPFIDDQIPTGTHKLEVRKTGFTTWEETISVLASKPLRRDVSLEPAVQLFIDSIPTGAQIMIGEQSYGETPQEIENLKIGTYELALSLDKYQTHREKLSLSEAEQTKTISVKLLPLSFGALRVISETGVAVSVDDVRKGYAPLLLKEIPVGRHTITLTSAHKSKKQITLTISKNKTTKIEHLFYQPGTLRINAIPFGEAYLDGFSHGITPVFIDNVPQGEHQIKVVKKGYRTAVKQVTVKKEDEATVFLTLKKR
ncbi:PEGA domain-containing protein [candidate division CSSED10-310 bacterium]|uniref:PEGA domain-containing protein n=1 Tax=candidate division CSSED10-310 bacterium TaxID=2855610 RepID=A0ABV6YZ25_UNCC1